MESTSASELRRSYDKLQAAWRLGLSLHRPDWPSLWNLHQRLCALETLLARVMG